MKIEQAQVRRLLEETCPTCQGQGWIVGCRILGRDIGVGLENLIKQMKARDIDHLEERLDAYAGREVAKLTSKGREDKAQAVDDDINDKLAAWEGAR